jgi:prophage DNA circulation protein
MSGFTNITGFAPPTTAAGFLGLLQAASFRGVPFKVISSAIRKGRKGATHNYPFRDGGWREDMGRALRVYSFTGYLIGDDAAAMQLLFDNALEAQGPGLLIHPSVGAQMVSVLSGATSIRKDAGRLIEVALEFVEQGERSLLTTLNATAIQVISAADLCLPAAGSDLGNDAGAAAEAGSAPLGEATAVTTSFGAACQTGGADPASVINLAAGLPPPDSNSTYGRYSAGSTSTALPAGTTIASLQSTVTTQRAAISAAAAIASTSAETFSTATAPAMVADIAAIVEAMRATMTDPADQVRVLLSLATFSYADGADGAGLGGDMATVRDAFSTACRRTAVISLARAASAYQPISYQDAQNILELVAGALDVEITAAGDAADDDTYATLRALRASVAQDLTTRGTTLPQVITANFNLPLPSLVVAQMLYEDASRSDQVVLEVNPPHPAFCPTAMQVLAS